MSTTTDNFSSAGRTRLGWPALIALVLTPLVVASLLAWGFGSVSNRLDKVQAVVVNHDKMAELDGNKVPLGRQFAAKLIASSGQFDWQLDSESSAAKKLDKGDVVAVVTIPKDFSDRAISYAKHPKSPVQSEITVATSKHSSILNKSLTNSLVASARQAFNTEMTKSYLDNIYLSFGKISGNLGTAADGSNKLANGSKKLADGNKSLATGAYKLSDGLVALGTGTKKYVNGVGKLADGSTALAKGTGKLANGTKKLSKGASGLAKGVDQTKNGTHQLANGLSGLKSGADQLNSVSASVAKGAQGITEALPDIQKLAQGCAGGSQQACSGLDTAIDGISKAAAGVSAGATGIHQGLAGDGSSKNPGLANGIKLSAKGAKDLDNGMGKLSEGASGLAKGTKDLSTGTAKLATGADKLAEGARTAAGAGGQLVDGVTKTSGGAAALGNGADKLADGNKTVATGIADLADGLDKAATALPNYSKSERKQLVATIAAPLKATQSPLHGLLGSSTMPWIAALALWMGLLATYTIMQAVPRRARFSTKSALALAARSYVPGAVVGANAGLCIGILTAAITKAPVPEGLSMAGLGVLAGLSFAAVHQGLAGLFGWVGRMFGMLMGVLIAVSVVAATVPSTLTSLAALTPLAGLLNALQSVLTGATGMAAAITLLIVWGLIGFLMSVFATLRARTTKSPEAKAPEVSNSAA